MGIFDKRTIAYAFFLSVCLWIAGGIMDGLVERRVIAAAIVPVTYEALLKIVSSLALVALGLVISRHVGRENKTKEYLRAAVFRLEEEIKKKDEFESDLTRASDDWRATFDATSEMIFMVDQELRVVKANRAASAALGLQYTELVGRRLCDVIECGEREQSGVFELVASSHEHREHEVFVPRLQLWLSVSVDPIVAPDRGGFVVIMKDITEMKELQDSIVRARDEWEGTFNLINDAITVHDRDFNIVRSNEAGKKLLGLGNLDSGPVKCYRAYHGAQAPPASCTSCAVSRSGLASEEIIYEPHLKRHLEIRAFPRFDSAKNIIGIVHIVRDITEKVKLQSELRHAQKMDILGQLAGGIAHDFNNLISGLMGFGNLILIHRGSPEKVAQYARHVLDVSGRAAQLTKGLLAFSRKHVPLDLAPQDLNHIVRSFHSMLVRVIGEHISVDLALWEGDLPLLAEPVHIDQLLMNLALNARDAMPEGGVLRIGTGIIPREMPGSGGVRNYAVLSFSDTGCGIPDEIRDRVFEPFFTTKDVGKGTGLGLSIVFGVVQQHQGFIDFASVQDQGTTFTIGFPLLERAEITPVQQRDELMRGKGEAILVVEDDRLVREVVRIILFQHGYEVIEAVDGSAGIDAFHANRERVRLVLTDLVMPKKNGREFLEEIRKSDPGVKAIMMSGYTDDVIQRGIGLDRNIQFIPKPVIPSQLLSKIRAMLGPE